MVWSTIILALGAKRITSLQPAWTIGEQSEGERRGREGREGGGEENEGEEGEEGKGREKSQRLT